MDTLPPIRIAFNIINPTQIGFSKCKAEVSALYEFKKGGTFSVTISEIKEDYRLTPWIHRGYSTEKTALYQSYKDVISRAGFNPELCTLYKSNGNCIGNQTVILTIAAVTGKTEGNYIKMAQLDEVISVVIVEIAAPTQAASSAWPGNR